MKSDTQPCCSGFLGRDVGEEVEEGQEEVFITLSDY